MIRTLCHRLVVLVLSLIALGASALNPDTPLKGYSTRTWYSDDGLPHNTVQAIAQTPDGYLWFGTWNGVARYNGREFKVFNSENSTAFVDNGVRGMVRNTDGALWVTTAGGGANVWRGASGWSNVPGNALMALMTTKTGDVWLGSRGQGIMVRTSGGVERMQITPEQGLGEAWIYGLLEDVDGAVWIASSRGLFRYVTNKLENIGEAQGLPPGAAAYALLRDHKGVLWLGTEAGLYRLRAGDSAGIHFEASKVPLHSTVQCLSEDRNGNLWIGTQSAGLWRLKGDAYESLMVDHGLTNNRVLSIYEDQEGSLWVGTNSGLMRFSDSGFTRISRRDGLGDEFVRSITPATQGMWVGTSDGLNLVGTDANENMQVQRLEGTPVSHASVLSVLQTRDQSLWVGTYDNGLWLRTGARWQQFSRSDESLPHNQVRALLQASDDAVWVGTARGVLRLVKVGSAYQEATQILRSQAFPSTYVMSFMEARDHRLWVGTGDGFFILPAPVNGKIDLAATVHFRHGTRFPAANVFDFHEDAAGVVWLATELGLVRFVAEKFTVFGRAAGLPTNAVFSISEDASDELWLTSNDGLIRLSREQIEAYERQPTLKLAPQLYNRTDGMSAAQINGSSMPSAAFAPDGTLWLPTARGVTVLSPKRQLAQRSHAVSVVIESVRVDRVEQNPSTEIVAPSSARRYEVEFAGLSYLAPERVHFRYRLNGLEPQWSTLEKGYMAVFTHLPPGDFTFEVQAASTGTEFGESTRLQLRVLPRWNEHWWFWPLLALMTAGLVGLAFVWKSRQQRARRFALEQQVAERTAELSERNIALAALDQDKSTLLNTIQMQSQAFARQAREDYLTGIANRRYFDLRAASAFAEAQAAERALVVAIVDIDNFKSVNDTCSHEAGDEVLKAVARVLADIVGNDGMAARFGGEEFGVFFNSLSLLEAQPRLEQMRAGIAALRFDSYPNLRVSISAGLTDTTHVRSYERSMARADALLYQAKDLGRNQVVVEPD
jgi:diguanylate cyclase (GGDEF)-like protein